MKSLQEMRELFAGRLGVDIPCACGRVHRADIDTVLIGAGASSYVPDLMKEKKYKNALLLCDENTWQVAGQKLEEQIKAAGLKAASYIYQRGGSTLIADEQAMYEGTEAYLDAAPKPDVIIAVGTGTLNDLSKEIAQTVGVRAWIVGTAASMDGFASTVAALTRDNLKVTEYYTPPEVIIGDTDILRTAPREMTLAGIADMAAKYNARLDWRLSRLINNEYYCDFIADGMLKVTDDIIDMALTAPEDGSFPDALLERLMEGLVMSGVYMSYTGTSRAASGAEHHFSHFWEMWLQVNGKPPIYHGVKVGVGAMTMAELYPKYLTYKIPEKKALAANEKFDEQKEIETLKKVYKEAAPMLLQDYDYHKDERRLRIPTEVEKREQINEEIRAMLPRLEKMKQALVHIGARTRWEQLNNISEKEAREAMRYCKAMRPQFTLLQLMQDTVYPLKDFEDAWIAGKEQNTEEVTEIKEETAMAEKEIAAEKKVQQTAPAQPKKRGRKPGSKNKPKAPLAAAPAVKEPVIQAPAPKEAPKKKKQELPYWLL